MWLEEEFGDLATLTGDPRGCGHASPAKGGLLALCGIDIRLSPSRARLLERASSLATLLG